MTKKILLLLLLTISLGLKAQKNNSNEKEDTTVELVILGTVQDAGSPHIGCSKNCCSSLFDNPDHMRKVVSLGVVDRSNRSKFLFEATPDITTQMKFLKDFAKTDEQETPDGIFLTHAHIGHYTGLMYLGKEAMNANRVKVYSMPKMKNFLEKNGPWSQLVTNGNIEIQKIGNNRKINLTPNLKVTPFQVPHRDEYSETVGYKIEGPSKSALFIPDIDKWEKWKQDIVKEVKKADYAFIDATFFDAMEINNRDISEIPHPFVIESMELFKNLPVKQKAKIHFIHFNHTNPLLNKDSEAFKQVIRNGFKIAQIHDTFDL